MEREQLLPCLLIAGSVGVLAGILILGDVVQAMGVQRNDHLAAEGRRQKAGGIYPDASGMSGLSTDRELLVQAPSKSPIWGHSFKGVANPRLNETSCLLPSISCLLQFSTNLEVILGDDAASEDLAVSEVKA